jgi:5-methylcytosine-specific restriction endonuclease McrA
MPFVKQEKCKRGHLLDEKNTYLFKRKDGRLSRSCRKCRNKQTRLKRNPHARHKGDHCEICQFVPVHECQLDVHHLDGNHANNDRANLQTVCANCHRLLTLMQNQFRNKDSRGRLS